MTTAIGHPVLDRIARALERGDRDALAALYAPNARYTSIDGSHPPAAPMRLSGTEVGDYIRTIPTEIRMVLDDTIVGTDGRLCLTTTCRFPDGASAVSAHVMELDGEGRIVDHRCVEAYGG